VFESDVSLNTPLQLAGSGADGLKQLMATLLRAFPDLQVSVEDMIEEADKVVGRNILTGTHLGEYMGLSPSGLPVVYDEIFIFRFVSGRIGETWGVVDVFSQMRQLGAISY
jgi:predicted ester cyclase